MIVTLDSSFCALPTADISQPSRRALDICGDSRDRVVDQVRPPAPRAATTPRGSRARLLSDVHPNASLSISGCRNAQGNTVRVHTSARRLVVEPFTRGYEKVQIDWSNSCQRREHVAITQRVTNAPLPYLPQFVWSRWFRRFPLLTGPTRLANCAKSSFQVGGDGGIVRTDKRAISYGRSNASLIF